MKKLITVMMLSLFVMACKEDQRVTKSAELALAGAYIPQDKIPSSYAFNWRITYEMEANDKKMDCHYMVKPKASYFGVVMELNGNDLSKNTITIKDFGRRKSLNLRKGKGGKLLYVRDMPELKDNDQSITIERIGTKDILGATCQGYKITMDAGIGTLYMTQDAGFAFNKDFEQYSKKRLEGKGIDASILNELENGLLMEMSFEGHETDASASASKMTIKEMTELKFSVDLSEYKIIGG
tara:strand:- start:5807 stop:6523 length:717 start_codon:yes stop_codon:yes gene_type:complete